MVYWIYQTRAGLIRMFKGDPHSMAGKQSPEYNENQIQVLEGLEAVRKRPGMYIGSTSVKGLHHLVYEIVDNSIDEALAGVCDRIDVTLYRDGQVGVRDNGRGVPTGIHPKVGIPTLEVVLTMLHAGGKFGGGGYKVSGGLHGVGLSVVNALSSELVAYSRFGGALFVQHYAKGKPMDRLTEVEKTNQTGFEVIFRPDAEIFEDVHFPSTHWRRACGSKPSSTRACSSPYLKNPPGAPCDTTTRAVWCRS